MHPGNVGYILFLIAIIILICLFIEYTKKKENFFSNIDQFLNKDIYISTNIEDRGTCYLKILEGDMSAIQNVPYDITNDPNKKLVQFECDSNENNGSIFRITRNDNDRYIILIPIFD